MTSAPTAPSGMDYLSNLDSRLAEDTEEQPLEVATDPSVIGDAEPSLQQRFETFHAENPHVYKQLRTLALDMVDQGYTKIGIGMLWEVMRWQTMTATNVAGGEPKLNNDHRSRYARLLMRNVPSLAGAFNIRELRS